jgi:hypothetical protein
MLTGRCHCGAIRYELKGAPNWSALCHCSDCRRHAGAPVVGWAAFPENALTLSQGQPKVYGSSEHGRRHFCADCTYLHQEFRLPTLLILHDSIVAVVAI